MMKGLTREIKLKQNFYFSCDAISYHQISVFVLKVGSETPDHA